MTEDITGLPPGTAAWLTVIVPTRNESESIQPLLRRLAPALGDVPAEVLFVDDSTDDTPESVRREARGAGVAIRLLHRPADRRADGLGGAVLAGLRAARSPWAVVMDCDLQHPPELVARLVAVGHAREVDLVVGTRYTDGGHSDGLANPYRRFVSSASTRFTKTLFPRSLALISDPMSGFFAVRIAALDLDRLRPRGFKILLEIAVRENRLRVAEVPFEFGDRVAGVSKASVREGVRFARHVMNLRLRVLRRSSATYAQSSDAAEKAPRDPTRVVVHVPAPVRRSDDTVTFESTRIPPAALRATRRRSKPGSAYLPYRYAIGSVLTIGSQVRLPELEYFRAQWVGNKVDLTIRVGEVGPRRPRSRPLITQYAAPPSLTYEEHLGRLGTNFEVHIGDPVEVICTPALAKSPHVLYTNVVEALLRFLAVSRGVVLLHSACMELNGSGLLLSARTDTGKTGTVLRMVRDYGALFLSDDMTLVHPAGRVECFPKPLTISHHTLQAIQAGDLTSAEWRRLRLQSRLHSKEGRQFGMLLAGLNIPIMNVNAVTQRVVPPPKYPVDRLIECQITDATVVRNLFVIERGSPAIADISFDDMIDTLIDNTDDAYGFPPFRHLAPSIVIGGEDYERLRQTERALLTRAMADVRARHVVCDDFTWCDRIAGLVGAETETSEASAMGSRSSEEASAATVR